MIDKESFQQIRSFAEKNFTGHRVTQMDGGVDLVGYRCGKPNTARYSFRVIFAPGMVFLYGDVGNLTLKCSEADSLAWLKESVESPDYLLSKAKHKCVEHNPRIALRYLRRLCEDGSFSWVHFEEINRLWYDVQPYDEFLYWNVYFDVTENSDVPSTHYFSSDALWSYFCLKRFVELLELEDFKSRGTE